MPTPSKVNRNSKGEGFSKALFFEEKYDTEMEFLEGWWGFKLKNLPWELVVWIFSGTTLTIISHAAEYSSSHTHTHHSSTLMNDTEQTE